MQYYVTKTGMEMLDVNRAWGLGLILHQLKIIQEKKEEIVINDSGYYYELTGPKFEKFGDFSNDSRWIRLFEGSEKDWRKPFLTLNSSQRERKIKKYEKYLSENLKEVLDNHSEISEMKIVSGSSRKGYDTIYQSLSGEAGKGVRKKVIKANKQHTEGRNIYAPKLDLAPAYLGAAKIAETSWKVGSSSSNVTIILPNPKRANMSNYLDIMENDWASYGDSVKLLVARSAVNLAKKLREKRVNQSEFSDKYDRIVFNSMQVSRMTQFKPVSTGSYRMDFLNSLLEENLEKTGLVLKKLGQHLHIDESQLKIVSADFLETPSLGNWEKYLKAIGRQALDRPYLRFSEKVTKEMINYIRD